MRHMFLADSMSLLAYLVAAALFILALRGLSSQETARRGNLYGIVGMAIAILATLTLKGLEPSWVLIASIGGGSDSTMCSGRAASICATRVEPQRDM